jgi:hypothetical protein
MSRVNSKKNVFIESKITNVQADSVNYFYTITFEVLAVKTWNVVYKNSKDILKSFYINQKINTNSISFYDSANTDLISIQSGFIIVSEVDFSNYQSESLNSKIIIKAKLAADSVNSNFQFDSTNINNLIVFPKIGAGSLKSNNNSGSLSVSLKNSIRERSSEIGTLPASKITTGKELANFNHIFDETNVIEFSEFNNVNIPVGLPLKQTNIADKFYITTASDLIDTTDPDYQSTISVADDSFIETYDLHNSRVFSSPNKIDNTFITNKLVSSRNIEHILKQKRFEEKFEPFREESYYFEEEDERSSFYTETIDSDKISKNYSLGQQKQIKIELDFSEDFNLHLMNTKFSFVNLYNNMSNNKADFNDSLSSKNKIYDTRFLNFLKGVYKESYSSHHMPTAYWNNKNKRWSYLDAAENAYSGAKINDNTIESQIPNNYIFLDPSVDSSQEIDLRKINVNNHKRFKYFHYNKPLMTTPSFRNDGSLLSNINSEDENKSMISQISDSYGFPYKAIWQPADDHLIDMSKYIAKDFLLEKMIIKGKFTSKGEMPVNNGNFYSGFLQDNSQSDVANLSEFGFRYRNLGYRIDEGSSFGSSTNFFKDDAIYEYIANNVTFFLLNERENENFIQNKISFEANNHYTYLFSSHDDHKLKSKSLLANTLEDIQLLNYNNSIIEDLTGELSTYEVPNNQTKLVLKSYLVENNALYSIDEYNNLSSNTDLVNESNFNKSRFCYLDLNTSSEDASFVDNLYYKKRDLYESSGTNDFKEDLNTVNNVFAKIKIESTNNLNLERGRELVTYSNMLITSKKNSLNFDPSVLKNIDLHVNTDVVPANSAVSVSGQSDFHLDINSPKDFVVRSFCKNNTFSNKNYLDESQYEFGSNFYSTSIARAEETSVETITNVVSPASPASNTKINLFTTTDGTTLTNILGYTIPSGPVSTPYTLNNGSGTNYALTISSGRQILDASGGYTNSNVNIDTVPFIEITFSFKNPTDSDNNPIYGAWNNPSTHLKGGVLILNQEPSVDIRDFITYSTGNSVDSAHSSLLVNKIDLNLRFLDMWQNYSILKKLLDFGRVYDKETFSDRFVYRYPDNNVFDLPCSLNDDFSPGTNAWNTYSVEDQSAGISLFLFYALIGKKLITDSGYINTHYPSGSNTNVYVDPQEIFKKREDDTFKVNRITDSNNVKITEISLNMSHKFNYLELSETDGVEMRQFRLTDNFTSSMLTTNFSTRIESNGKYEITQAEPYKNSFFVLEGKTTGSKNLDISSNRIINKELLESNSIQKYRSFSGKYLHEGDAFNTTVRSNYLLKPSDKLVFGVSSNSNGQVMPTVFKLHEKLEIILIGRDYVDNNIEYKNNLSKSIRKVVIGDDYIKKSGNTIYQTKGNVFDNIWSKNNLNRSLSDFKEGKIVTGKNSSRHHGTYSGIITLTNEEIQVNNSQAILFKKDTVLPSLGKVFNDCLSLKTIENNDLNDKSTLNILISESFENIDNSINVINKWHKTYPFHTFKSFFNNLENRSEDDNTFSNIPNENSKDILVLFDSNSYKPVNSLREFNNIATANFSLYDNSYSTSIKNDVISNIKKHGQTIREFTLPSSGLNSYQQGIKIQRVKDLRVWRENTKKFVEFIENDKIIEKYDSVFSNINNEDKLLIQTASLQYFDSYLNILENKNLSNNSTFYEYKDISRESLKEYKNDTQSSSENFIDFNPQWHIVFDLSFLAFSNLLDLNQTLNHEKITRDYLNKNIFLFLYENLSDNKPKCKTAKIIKSSSNDNKVTIVIPLYYWETLEIDDTFLSTNNSAYVKYGKKEYQEDHNFYSYSNNNQPAWYARLNNSLKIIDTEHIYKPFVNSSEHSNLNAVNSKYYPLPDPINNSFGTGNADIQKASKVPYTFEELSNLNITNDQSGGFINSLHDPSDKLILNSEDRQFYISNVKFKTDSINTPTYSKESNEYSNLDNFYKNSFHNRFLTGEKYFENNLDEIDKRKDTMLKASDEAESFYLNEKIYRSKIYKKSENNFIKTKYYLLYKINNMYTNNTSFYNSGKFKVEISENDTSNSGGQIVTSEVGDTGVFFVVLTSKPSSNVTVTISGLDVTEGTLSTNSLTFTTVNWNQKQSVTITGINDNLSESGSSESYTLTLTSTSSDSDFNNLTESLSVLNMHSSAPLYFNNYGETKYSAIEILGVDTDYSLFEKLKYDDMFIVGDLENKDIIRVYEPKLIENNYLKNSMNFKSEDYVPYFEIDLSHKSKGFTNVNNGINQILYSGIKLASSLDITTNLDVSEFTPGSLGSTIYRINEENRNAYRGFEVQEDAVKNFFYGFSKDTFRYPLKSLDGFKYGVEAGNKQSFRYHYNISRFGHFSDKVSGSTNTATIFKDPVNSQIIEKYPVEKKFVDVNYLRVNVTDNLNTYNTDLYSRSTHPYIENSSDQISQYYSS